MKTIYNLINSKNPINQGMVEVFNMYDYNYYLIVLDGKIVKEIQENTDYEEELLEHNFLKKLMKKSAVESEDLMFVYYEFEKFARNINILDYDQNDYDYQKMYDLVNNNLSQSQQLYSKVLYHGVNI